MAALDNPTLDIKPFRIEITDAALADLPGWERAAGALHRSVKFPTFLEGIDAVRRVVSLADRTTTGGRGTPRPVSDLARRS